MTQICWNANVFVRFIERFAAKLQDLGKKMYSVQISTSKFIWQNITYWNIKALSVFVQLT